METRDTEKAFRWIVEILQRRGIPFQIDGGFAARVYGSHRELADIDIGIPDDRFDDLYEEVKEYLTFGPARYVDHEWDVQMMTLVYAGQEIDIDGETTVRFFDKATQTWITGRCDFSKFEMKEVFGLMVPVIPEPTLITDKKETAREVDLLDVAALENNAK